MKQLTIKNIKPLQKISKGCIKKQSSIIATGTHPAPFPLLSISQDGNTAIDLALEHGNEMCVRILQRYLEEPGEEQNLWFRKCQDASECNKAVKTMCETFQSSIVLIGVVHSKNITFVLFAFLMQSSDEQKAFSPL